MGIKDILSDRKNQKIQKKSDQAYDMLKKTEKYATSDEFMIKLNGDISLYKPFLNRIQEEGYDYKIDTVDGELFSPSILYIRIRKPGKTGKRFI